MLTLIELVEQRFGPDVKHLAETVLSCGLTASNARIVRDKGYGKIKKGFGPNDWVTRGDISSESLFLEMMFERYGDTMKVMLEEVEHVPSQYRPLLIPFGAVDEVPKLEHFKVADGIDGTEEHYLGCAEWSISVGDQRYGRLRSGCVLAPDINNGLLAVGKAYSTSSSKKGVMFFEHASHNPLMGKMRPLDQRWRKLVQSDPEGDGVLPEGVRLPAVRHGVSLTIEKEYYSFVNTFCRRASPKSIVSCALGLTYVACGKIHAFVHRPLPWYDLAGGAALVLAAGGGVQYYDIDEHHAIQLLDRPNYFGRTGIIAGHPEVVAWLSQLLPSHYRKSISF